jgi:uncharacterized protein (UPF0332 family)
VSPGPDARDPLDRAAEEIAAAHALLAAGFPTQAVARAGEAGVQAARGALLAVDEAPATDAGVVALFVRRVVVQGGLDPEHGAALRRLFDDRREVEQALAQAPATIAEATIADAAHLLAAAAAWAAARRPGAAARAAQAPPV